MSRTESLYCTDISLLYEPYGTNQMKIRILSKLASQIICAVLPVQLAGCGTLARESIYGKIYRGVRADVECASESFFWIFSLGLMPVSCILSLPIDAVADTILIPVDLAIINSPKNYEPDYIHVFAVNMTGQPDFDYNFRKKSTGEIIMQARTILPGSSEHDLWRSSGKLYIKTLRSALRPETMIVSWNIVTQPPLEKATDTNGFVESFTLDDNLRGSINSLIALFMPCNRVMLVNQVPAHYSEDFTQRKAVQDVYQQLKSLSERSQCSAAGQIKLSMEGVWH